MLSFIQVLSKIRTPRIEKHMRVVYNGEKKEVPPMGSFMEEYIEKYRLTDCPCGKAHRTAVKEVIAERGAVARLPELVTRYGGSKVFLLADRNTDAAAGGKVRAVLERAGLSCSAWVFPESPKPDEKAVGAALMHYDHSCDLIVGIGSGVINDIGKLLSRTAKVPYIIVATAPSMDGYASGTSSMDVDGLKVSLDSRVPDVILGDIDILKEAPLHTLKSGLGDMLAKYISLCEWDIARLLIGEYHCERVAELIRTALAKCVDNARGLLRREEEAVKAVFEGLILGGIAMSYAGLSRPAAGMEHYISHVWDMRGLALGTPTDTHGIQCAIGTLYCAKLYEKLRTVTPDKEKALAYAAAFDVEDWYGEISAFMGSGGDAMIALDRKERKYDKEKHAQRLEKILDHWEEIRGIFSGLPTACEIEAVLDAIEAPKDCEAIGLDREILPMTVMAAKDIRDKYVLSRLLWDLGILEEFAQAL